MGANVPETPTAVARTGTPWAAHKAAPWSGLRDAVGDNKSSLEAEPAPVALLVAVMVAVMEPVIELVIELVALIVAVMVGDMVGDMVALIVAVIEGNTPQLSSHCTSTEAKEPPSSGTMWNPQYLVPPVIESALEPLVS